MAFCRYCGKPIDENAKTCPSCGAAVGGAQSGQNTQDATNGAGIPSVLTADGYDSYDIERTKIVCAVSYIYILFFLPLVVYPDSRYGKFHANQALLMLIVGVALNLIASAVGWMWGILFFVPSFIGETTQWIVNLACYGIQIAGMVFGIVNALNGRAKELPLIGHINLINK